MTTNPYASPIDVDEPVHQGAQEIRSVIRAFRIAAIFSIAEALLYASSVAFSLASGRMLHPLEMLVFMAVHLLMFVSSVFYLHIAGRMARQEAGAGKWAGRLSLLMILGFPLFPIGLFCLPVFAVAGVMCYRKVKRYYFNYCEVLKT